MMNKIPNGPEMIYYFIENDRVFLTSRAIRWRMRVFKLSI